MLKLLSIVRKDFLLLLRDKAGLAVLFLMPTALVLVISLVHDTALKATQNPTLKLLLLNHDKGLLSDTVEDKLRQLGCFQIHTGEESRIPTLKEARSALIHGDFKVCIFIPQGTSQTFDTLARQLITSLVPAGDAHYAGLPQPETSPDTLKEKTLARVQVILDPAIPDVFRETIMNALSRSVTMTEMEIILNGLSHTIGSAVNAAQPWGVHTQSPPPPYTQSPPSSGGFRVTDSSKYNGILVEIKEDFVFDSGKSLQATSTQQNVPAWTMFAMFFIVVPLSGHLINERQNGVLKRMMVAPVSYFTVLLAKVIVYLVVCLSQFLLMLLVGFKVLPLFGAPKLEIGTHCLALLIVAVAAALAAIGFGLAVGTIMRNHQQASTFGAVMTIIAAALGGVMVPVYVMPEFMQKLSGISPLAWGLNAFLDVFLRHGDLASVLPNVGRLIVFFVITMFISFGYYVWRRD
jgi:ABC-2 type transport system permease protein